MGTTINGVYTGGKQGRRQRALKRLEQSIKFGYRPARPGEEDQVVKGKGVPYTDKQKETMKKELETLTDRLSGIKKKREVKNEQTGEVIKKDRWFIDIYHIHMSSVKRSDRKKNKGKSRKKMRSVRSRTFVKSVVFQEGMMQSFRDGKMGISPKNHSFVARKEELSPF